jgi:hypothetical protein
MPGPTTTPAPAPAPTPTPAPAPAPAPVLIKDAANLPGAFLFFRFTTPKGSFAGIAYDPTITKDTKLKQLQDRYFFQNHTKNLPYIEKFAPIPSTPSSEGTKIWKGDNSVYYGETISQTFHQWTLDYKGGGEYMLICPAGIFGGPDPVSTDKTPSERHRVKFSSPWPWAGAKSTSPIRDGVYVSFWYTKEAKAMHTSSISKHLDKNSQVPYMHLKPGQPDFNLVGKDLDFLRETVTGVYLDWYATLEKGDFRWDTEQDLKI